MDFKSLMSAQIAKSKPPAKTTATASTATKPNKYVRRADLEAAREAEYAAEQARLSAEREERAAKKRKLEDEEAERNAAREEKKQRLAEESRRRREEEELEEEKKRRKRLGLPEVPHVPGSIANGGDGSSLSSTRPGHQGEDIADDGLRTRLRELGEPASLFDETHSARLKRYRSLTAKTLAPKLSDGPIPTTLAPVPEKDMLIPAPPLPTKETNSEGHTFLYRQLASYFTLLLTEWGAALSQRASDVKASSSGKAAHNAYLMVLADLTPLFRHFERETLSADLLEPICAIVRSAQHRRYVEANDGYLTLSIGKAAWPIGVTMVGIHERSAREKLHESSSGKQAHIMTDEVTRKFLQSIKRCISFAQTRWPPDDLGQLMG
ncbi:uncharacterized protein A1O9_07892 [Exophiala aquamarina CBS 119918]|uniref:Pre-mRNA-splicing factor 18 n=1 Tax=Exophiala aquamarina CBS 119918 TaxID=1182545 RepID=A0A072P8Z8_9EURO|nr:uncharacterized protein A1O9_07892 [Exophiala aquamarina CBS 119918]KEF56311.1 hypothetical protein A1O9_07892 [Exophiala aquamarina CBS 119918]